MVTKVYYALDVFGATFEDAYAQGLRIAEYNFPRPAVKTVTIDVPGRDGLVDLSEALTGGPTFENVIGTVRFIVLKGASFDLKSFINTYHGRVMKIYTDEDTTHYRIGRATVTVEELKLGKLRTFTLTMNAEPFLWNMTTTDQSFTVSAGDTTGWSMYQSYNMATGYPTADSTKITLKAASASGGYAYYRVPVDETKMYIAVASPTNSGTWDVLSNGDTYTEGQLIVPAVGQTTLTVRLYTPANTSNTVFNRIALLPVVEIPRDAVSVKTTTPTIYSSRTCALFVSTGQYGTVTRYALSLDEVLPLRNIDPKRNMSGSTGFYIALGLASSAGTAKLSYRGGVLA